MMHGPLGCPNFACNVDRPRTGTVDLDDPSVLLWGETSWRLWPNNRGALDML